MFIPSGDLTLIKGVPFDNTYNHTRKHTSLSNQLNYFNKMTKLVLADFTPMRANSSIKVGYGLDDLRGYNYCYYQNSSGSKTIFCFITDKIYVNDTTTELMIQTDIMQTYMFDYSFKHSFIERCHVPRWNGSSSTHEIVDEGIPLQEHTISSSEVVAQTPRRFIMTSTAPLGQVVEGGYIPPVGGDTNNPNVGTGTYLNGLGGSWLVPSLGRISANWGSYTNGSYVHDGIDIANVEGTPIYCSANGTVTNVGDNGTQTWGKYVDVTHGNGYMTRYAHCHTINVTNGQSVQVGQQIATMGNTGNSTGNHLHWGVYRDGVAIDIDSRDVLKIDYIVEQGKGNI